MNTEEYGSYCYYYLEYMLGAAGSLATIYDHHSISLTGVQLVRLVSARGQVDKRQIGPSRSLFNLILSIMDMGSTGRFFEVVL